MRRILCFLVLLIALAALGRNLLFRKSEIDLIVVLAGGVGSDGVPHETVLRRLRRAAQLQGGPPFASVHAILAVQHQLGFRRWGLRRAWAFA